MDPPSAPEPTPFPIRIVSDPDPVGREEPEGPPPGNESGAPRRDAFYPAWERFLAVEPKRAKSASRAAKKIDEEREAVAQTPGDGLHTAENAARSWEEAAAECKAKVAAIVAECKRLNQKYRDAIFNLEQNPYCLQSLTGRFPKAVDNIDSPPWIKRVEDIFDDPQFFIDGATATDVHQGSGGDCWFLASLMAVTAKKELIERLCVARDEKVGVYGFVFFRDGEWIHEVIDDKLFLRVGDDDDLKVVRDWNKDKKEGMQIWYENDKLKNVLQRGGEALYFSHCKSNETWLPLIEKAYAKAHGDYFAIEGGYASEGIEDLTGGVAVVLNPEDIMDKDRFWKEQLYQVNKKYLFGGGSKTSNAHGFLAGHAYAVLEAWEEGELRLLKLRNPWGEVEWDGDWSDGSKLWTAEMMTKLKHTFGDDGVFWISYKDFLKEFPCINRVRLFDQEWSVGQQWTCVSVPWTVDYLDTKFQFTISEKGPVVIVLAQPDDRYFYGLRGRYLYSLHFRVYKQGQDSGWIVRSMHNSGNETVYTRSVSAEIEDLEPGTYDVIFKVTAYRSTMSNTAEESIMKFAVDRKEKLLQVGRRFDYAQTKGDLRGMERTTKKGKINKLKATRKENWKKARVSVQQDRARERKRKQRIAAAIHEKQKAFVQVQREKARARKERAARRAEVNKSDDKIDRVTPESSGEPTIESVTPEAQEGQKTEATTTGQAAESTTDNVEANAGEDATKERSEEDMTKGLANLQIQDQEGVESTPAVAISPINEADNDHDSNEEDEDDEYDSPAEPPAELDDDDFPWDSDMDGPAESESDDDGSPGDIFSDDPWNALCVLGLRVYSKNKDVNVRVIKAATGA